MYLFCAQLKNSIFFKKGPKTFAQNNISINILQSIQIFPQCSCFAQRQGIKPLIVIFKPCCAERQEGVVFQLALSDGRLTEYGVHLFHAPVRHGYRGYGNSTSVWQQSMMGLKTEEHKWLKRLEFPHWSSFRWTKNVWVFSQISWLFQWFVCFQLTHF